MVPCHVMLCLLMVSATSAPDCPNGSYPDATRELCYDVSSHTVAWPGARDHCSTNGMQLAEPRDLEQNLLIQNITSAVGLDLWLGVISLDGGSVFHYLSDVAQAALPGVWKDGGSNPPLLQLCAALDKGDNLSESENCSRLLPFVCERDSGNNGNGNCKKPNLWAKYNNRCYRPFLSTYTYSDAKTACGTEDGHLAQLLDQGIVDYVTSIMTDDAVYWVDGTSSQNEQGVWRYHDNTQVTWFPWKQGQPVNASERCVAMTSTGWDSLPCNASNVLRHFLCQINVTSSSVEPVTTQATASISEALEVTTTATEAGETLTSLLVTEETSTMSSSSQADCSTAGVSELKFHRLNVTSARVTHRVTQEVRSLLECVSACSSMSWCDVIAINTCSGVRCGRKVCHMMLTAADGDELVMFDDMKVMRKQC